MRANLAGYGARTDLMGEEYLVDNILDGYAGALGRDRVAYLNHVRRVLRYFRALAGECPTHVVIAAVFHDLGIWTERTFDYLEPSVRLANSYVVSIGCVAFGPEIEAIIRNHHKLTRYKGTFARTVEVFRRADLVDVSLGLVRFGLAPDLIGETKRLLPNAGFHRRLVALTAGHAARHPLRPLPMVRW